ncbi:MAG: helix-turn-helix domain-containing protein [Firmicutes bacterium]|nr:helix-turn-helix domain-containing protein [Bacillota bacterium]
MFDFGARLKELRIKKGLTQTQVAKKLNLHKSTISGYEGNTKTPSIDTICRLAIFYNTTTDYLLGMEKKKMICADGLTNRQAEIVESLLAEFRAKTSVIGQVIK